MIKKKQSSTEFVRIAERKGNMKKIIALCLCLIAVVSAVSGCSANTEKDNGKINISRFMSGQKISRAIRLT